MNLHPATGSGRAGKKRQGKKIPFVLSLSKHERATEEQIKLIRNPYKLAALVMHLYIPF